MKMKYQGEHLYLYVGWNGIMIALEFNFRGKYHDFEFNWMHYSCEV